jgi:hypothetical protein
VVRVTIDSRPPNGLHSLSATDTWNTGSFQARTYSAPSLEQLRSLPVGILKRTLDSNNIDHRRCVEKKDLVAKVHEVFALLPLPIRSELLALTQRPGNELGAVDVHHAALVGRVSRLQPDEQYSVKLYQVHYITCLRSMLQEPLAYDAWVRV